MLELRSLCREVNINDAYGDLFKDDKGLVLQPGFFDAAEKFTRTATALNDLTPKGKINAFLKFWEEVILPSLENGNLEVVEVAAVEALSRRIQRLQEDRNRLDPKLFSAQTFIEYDATLSFLKLVKSLAESQPMNSIERTALFVASEMPVRSPGDILAGLYMVGAAILKNRNVSCPEQMAVLMANRPPIETSPVTSIRDIWKFNQSN